MSHPPAGWASTLAVLVALYGISGLAKAIGVHRTTVHAWLARKRTPSAASYDAMLRLAEGAAA